MKEESGGKKVDLFFICERENFVFDSLIYLDSNLPCQDSNPNAKNIIWEMWKHILAKTNVKIC